ncbi:MAG: cell division protein ZapD [Burkholderiales bacterium]
MAQIVYEYPFNESIRTLLRLEQLFQRLATLACRESALDHHLALVTLFEIMDVSSRADIKSDLLQDLERQRKQLTVYRGKPSIDESMLNAEIARAEQAMQRLNQQPGKTGQPLVAHDWLMSIRSRISIPGGTCSFDLPSYHAWQHRSAAFRQAELQTWLTSLDPVAEALTVSLRLLRESGASQPITASGGRYQQSLGSGRHVQLARVRVEADQDWFPEISGNRLLLSIRVMHTDDAGRVEALLADRSCQLTLCA